MRQSSTLPALHWLGLALASLPSAAFGQAANPLGVEWVGGGASASPASPPAADNPLGVDWVGGGKGATRPAPAPAANNPLGVDWVGGGGTAASPASPPAAGNPLGVDWVGGGKETTRPAPAPTSGVRTDDAETRQPSSPAPQTPVPTEPSFPQTPAPPQLPTPVEPTPVQPAPDAPPPQPEAGQTGLAAALIDSWSYQAVAFSDGSGTVSETRGVSGTLTFKPDGQYEQALYIGGIANVMKGSYRIVGRRLETTYLWRGEAATDVFDFYLDPTGKRLTLTGLGSPKAHYTLQRVE